MSGGGRSGRRHRLIISRPLRHLNFRRQRRLRRFGFVVARLLDVVAVVAVIAVGITAIDVGVLLMLSSAPVFQVIFRLGRQRIVGAHLVPLLLLARSRLLKGVRLILLVWRV